MKYSMNTSSFYTQASKHIKLAAFDLDGTLLDSQRSLTPAAKKAVACLQQKGIYVVLVTGRSYSAVKPIYDQLGLHAPIVCYNGAGVVNGDDGAMIHSLLLPDHLTRGVIQIARRHNVHVHVFISDRMYYEKERKEAWDYEKQLGIKGTLVPFDEMKDLNVLKALCIADHEILQQVSRDIGNAYGENITRVFSYPHFLEVMDGRVNKVEGLKAVSRQYGISRDEMIAFGDGENDIEMLRYAGIGIAMENAYEHVKEAADLITASNDEEGITKSLKSLGLL